MDKEQLRERIRNAIEQVFNELDEHLEDKPEQPHDKSDSRDLNAPDRVQKPFFDSMAGP